MQAPAARGTPTPPRAQTLALRQQRLLVRSALLRDGLSRDLQALQAPLALADRVHGVWVWLREHREAVLAGGALLALLRPRRTLRWAGRGWALWRVARRLQPWLLVAWRLVNGETPTRR